MGLLPAVIYVLSFLASATCTWLLLRGYRRSGTRLLLWSGLCFVGLAINNVLLVASHVLFGAVAGGIYELYDHYDVPLIKERV